MKTYIKAIDHKYYAFAGDVAKDQVYSIGSDKPPKSTGCSLYFAKWTDSGIKYVSSPSPNYKAAKAKAKRHGEYCGIV